MRKTLLISEETIKDNSMIEMNVANKSLRVILVDVQHNQLRKLLGNVKYNSILDEVDNSMLPVNPVAITADSLDLIKDYLQPFLICGVMCDFLLLNNFKLTNKGTLQMSDNNANQSSLSDLESVKNYYDNKFAVAKMDLVEHLNEADTPCSGPTIKPTNSSITGLYIESSYNDFSDYFNSKTGRTKYL
jgi:hypothetical protein